MRRKDQRSSPQELREMQAELGVLQKADGSCKFLMGKTIVICSVNGPEASMKEKGDGAIVDVIFQPRDKRPSEEEKEYEMMIRESLENVILLSLYPRTIITISVQVVQDDGSLLSASLNSAVLALLDAGVALKSTLVSLSCSYLSSGDCLLDPLKVEQDFDSVLYSSDSSTFVEYYKSSLSTGQKIIKPKGHVCFIFDASKLKKKSQEAEEDTSLVTCLTEGIFTDEALQTCLNMAKEGAHTVYNLIRFTMERKSTTPILPISTQPQKTQQNVTPSTPEKKGGSFLKPKDK
ncbi:hypothetical protein C9374_006033 [Naegleria lovaniensis]|uniref:Exoribonuclease phosphorolytic domain-containing protein n=1 Tax=Naegleria lovaniensis TaxID=51637 RepID=A0AA88KHC9_NAELO|nr:uncharacterized protein C9374_006033 [Naegleria lovaniensis]KAG2381649.1 hypothetical protein C9374_006033 [Naegleria lovaniensis]